MNSITFVFDIKQATQAMAYLLSLNGNKMNYMKAIKLLYLTDHELLSKGHNPKTTDSYMSLKFGPVTGCILDCIRRTDNQFWNSYIRTSGYFIELINNMYTTQSKQTREKNSRENIQ